LIRRVVRLTRAGSARAARREYSRCSHGHRVKEIGNAIGLPCAVYLITAEMLSRDPVIANIE
jgi:hypothetical protein